MTIAYLGPEATFTHQAAIRRFGSSLHYASQKTIADVFAEVKQETRGLRRGAGRKHHRRRGHAHARHVRGQRPEDRFANCSCRFNTAWPANCKRGRASCRLYAHPQALGPVPVRGCKKTCRYAEIIETSSNARSAELAAHPQGKTPVRKKVGCHHRPARRGKIQPGRA